MILPFCPEMACGGRETGRACAGTRRHHRRISKPKFAIPGSRSGRRALYREHRSRRYGYTSVSCDICDTLSKFHASMRNCGRFLDTFAVIDPYTRYETEHTVRLRVYTHP